MYEFNKKQKIIIVIILSVIIIAFLYYIYTKDKSTFISSEELEVENTIEEETEEEESQKIIVHVSGAVNKEGIVELDADSRISDAIDKAEGLAENADTNKINLAFKLEDGMKIYIPKIGEEESEKAQESTDDETSKYITSASGVVDSQDENTESSSGKSTTGKVNINTASQTATEESHCHYPPRYHPSPHTPPPLPQVAINCIFQNTKFKENCIPQSTIFVIYCTSQNTIMAC